MVANAPRPIAEGHPPAKILADNAPDRNTKHHRQRGTGGDQAQRLRPFARRGHADGQCRRYRPEHCMRKGDTNAADHQHVKIPGKKRQDVAGDKQNKQADKQAPALHFAGKQHKRQRH